MVAASVGTAKGEWGEPAERKPVFIGSAPMGRVNVASNRLVSSTAEVATKDV